MNLRVFLNYRVVDNFVNFRGFLNSNDNLVNLRGFLNNNDNLMNF